MELTFTYPNKGQTESHRRWLSWQFVTRPGNTSGVVKGSYTGTASPTTVTKRRTKNKLAKASRKANR